MNNNNEKLQEDAVKLIYHIIDVCHPKLRGSDCTDVNISAPQFFIDLLNEAYIKDTGFKQCDIESIRFCGVKIIPGYEMCLIMFHKNYPKWKEDWMIKRIDLNKGSNEDNVVFLGLENPPYFKFVDDSENNNPLTLTFQLK